jgi:hypothetical protein
VDSALAGLGGDEQAVWDVIADVQKFGSLVGGVDRKVEVLQRIADRRVQLASAAATRRSTRILGLLSTFTLVTLATTLLAYFFGGFSESEHNVALRVGFLVAGILFAFIVWYLTFQLHPWRSLKNWRLRRSSAFDEL